MKLDPISLEVFKNLFASVAEEMGVALGRTGYSPNIKERRDYSCAVFDASGQMVAQAAHIPVHLGSMPQAVVRARAEAPLDRDDMVLLNDPYRGGTHLPDITLVAPVYVGPRDRKPLFYVANRAHHADVGGMTPGSLPLATEIFQEGIRIPPVTLIRAGKVDEGVLRLFLANVRTPREREGDLAAQIAANRIGQRRLLEIVAGHGRRTVAAAMDALLDYAERMTRRVFRSIRDGTYRFEDYLDDDGLSDRPVKISVTVTIRGEEARIDFTGTDPQVQGSVNAIEPIVHSAVFYVVRCLMGLEIPSNAGCMRPVTVVAPEGTVVNARFPGAVGGGNVETSQRIVDVLLGAFAQAMPDVIPAASAGTMNNLALGGYDPFRNQPFAYYETIAGGMGAGPKGPGLNAVHTHMTNTMNTPVEALEYAYPLRVIRYSLRRGSGGAGRHRGGDGVVREIEVLCDATLTLLSDRRRRGPYGLQGGRPGRPGRNLLRRGQKVEVLPGKLNRSVSAGQIIAVHTPGGGGFGHPGRKA
jgi:N-methylhydantoinase B